MRTQQRRGLDHPPPATISSPLYQRILQFEALSSCRQQGNDVRRFAVEFSGAAEGLDYNDEALKDLFNSALDEPLSWWRMRGLDHLTFGEFVEALARSPAKVAGVPQVVATRLQLLQWRQMALQCPYWWPSKLQRTLGSRGGYVSWRIPP